MENVIIKKIEKQFKTDVRRIEIYENSNIVCIAVSYYDFVAFTLCPPENIWNECRKLMFKNLHWLIGNNCGYNEWNEKLDAFKKDDLFLNDEEQQLALISLKK
jgi:hypothetical protein